MKALKIAAATALALAPFSVVATTPDVARAAPCAGVFANPTSCENCLHFVEVYHTSNVCDKAAPAQAAPSRVPVDTPEAPPEAAPPVPAVPEPALPELVPPSVAPVQSPTPQVVAPNPPPPRTIPVVPPEEPSQPVQAWWPLALGYGVLATAVGLLAWLISRRNAPSGRHTAETH